MPVAEDLHPAVKSVEHLAPAGTHEGELRAALYRVIVLWHRDSGHSGDLADCVRCEEYLAVYENRD